MRFEFLDIEVVQKALPAKFSKILNANMRTFSGELDAEGKAQVGDSETAKFFLEQVHYLLKHAYKINSVPDSLVDFEDNVSIAESIAFMEAQILLQGPGDFLIQPINALLQGLKRIVDSIPEIADRSARAALAPAKST